MRDTFSTFHPLVNFIFFFAVILFSMIFLHPVLLIISVAGALVYSLRLNGRKGFLVLLGFLLPMMIIAALINPLFNHRGMTILGYMNNNPITLESIYYGIAVGLMFGSVILWFSCFNVVMTSDKIIYLFGRMIPSLSLVFSMVLRFVPKFKDQIKVISRGQQCIGRNITDGSLKQRAKNGIKIISIMLTWAFENSIETADSMKARGYGLRGRTSFSIYRFEGRDKAALAILALLILILVCGWYLGLISIQYFPRMKMQNITGFNLIIYMAHFLLCTTPMIINFWEALRWRHLRSKI